MLFERYAMLGYCQHWWLTQVERSIVLYVKELRSITMTFYEGRYHGVDECGITFAIHVLL